MTLGAIRPLRRCGERGVTLIEMLVTLALMGLAVVAMLGLFQATLIPVRSVGTDAQLATQVRQVQDYLESPNFAYIQCGSFSQYDSALQTAITSGTLALRTATTAHVIGLQQPTGGIHTVNGTAGVALLPINVCNGGSADYGVQQLEVHVASGAYKVDRLVYKRWNN